MNQAEIIELFCINKEKPELVCDGKCYLKQILIESDKPTNEHSSNIPTSLKYEIIDYFLVESPANISIKSALTILLRVMNNIFIVAPFVTEVFEPPRCI